MTKTHDEYYVSEAPEDADGAQKVYWRVLNKETAQVWPEDADHWEPAYIHDLWMEDRNGFGLENVLKRETPWGDDGR